eukprot:scaffold13424_cov23-Tisochrysis_lutea.AAC.2
MALTDRPQEGGADVRKRKKTGTWPLSAGAVRMGGLCALRAPVPIPAEGGLSLSRPPPLSGASSAPSARLARERWIVARSSTGETTTEKSTAKSSAANVVWSSSCPLSDAVAMMNANSPHAAIAKPTVVALARVRGVAHTPVASLPRAARKKRPARPKTAADEKERTGTANLRDGGEGESGVSRAGVGAGGAESGTHSPAARCEEELQQPRLQPLDLLGPRSMQPRLGAAAQAGEKGAEQVRGAERVGERDECTSKTEENQQQILVLEPAASGEQLARRRARRAREQLRHAPARYGARNEHQTGRGEDGRQKRKGGAARGDGLEQREKEQRDDVVEHRRRNDELARRRVQHLNRA